MFVTITSITTIMRARMLHAVSPLLIWFWSAFPWLFCNFVFKSSVAASLMCDTMHDEWLQCQSAWECVDACMSVAICAAGVELWCACAFELWCENARMLCLRLWFFGDVLSHLNMFVVALLVKYRSCLWRYGCDVGHADWRETWKIFGCENVLKFYSNSISVHILQLLTIPPLFFTGSDDRTVRIWDVAAQQQVAELKGHTSNVTSVAFDSSGKYLASGERRGAWAAARYDCAMNVMAFVARIAIRIWMLMVVYE